MTGRARTATIAAGALLLATVLGSASSATADPATDGFWYYDVMHVQDAHDAGLTGDGIVIGVVDGQINTEVPTLQGAKIDVQPSVCWDDAGQPIPAVTTDSSAEHGTNIVSFLVGSGAGYPGQTGVKGIVPDATIIFTSAGRASGEALTCNDEEGVAKGNPIAEGVYAAIDAGADVISFSISGGGDRESEIAIAEALNKGIVILSTVPNTITDGYWPGSANGVVSVQAVALDGTVSGDFASQKNATTDVVGPGTGIVWQGGTSWESQKYGRGTSIATPIVAGFIALVAQKYPDATGNQLIQSLIHNTGVEDHELSYDSEHLYGYGTASATHMLRVDPTIYDDINPLIVDDESFGPKRAEIENPPERGSSEIDVITDDELKDKSPIDLPSLLAGIGWVIGGVLVTGVLVLIIALAIRRARRNSRV